MAEPTPVPAFDVLADETRWEILRELATHRRENWQLRGLGFAALRRAVGVDDAGRFNYHLDQLTGRFVTKHDDEYLLTNEGMALVGAALAGAYDTSDSTRREETSRSCPRCSAGLVAVYEFGYLRLECPSHGSVLGVVVPKRPALERPVEDVLRIAGRRVRSQIADARAEICPHCQGTARTSLLAEPPSYPGRSLDAVEREQAFVGLDCVDCGFHLAWPSPVFVVEHPATVAFRHEHGDSQSGLPYFGTSLSTVRSTRLHDPDQGPASIPASLADGFPRATDLEPPDAAAAVVEVGVDEESLVHWLDETAHIDTERVAD